MSQKFGYLNKQFLIWILANILGFSTLVLSLFVFTHSYAPAWEWLLWNKQSFVPSSASGRTGPSAALL